MTSTGGEAVALGIPGLESAAEIGRGGFGTVYRAEQPEFGRRVAVKVLREPLADPRVRMRFDRERKAMGALSGHPHIVTVYGGGLTGDGKPYIVMDYLTGGSLADRVQERQALPWQEVCDLVVKLAGALASAHRAGILHRDIKPENVLMSDYEEPKLADFGIARVLGGTETQTTSLTASVAHAAPELIGGQRPSERSDLYALGSTMFTLLSGRAAFVHTTDESILPALWRIGNEPVPDLRPAGVPDEVCAVVERLMAKDPEERYASAEELARDLQALQRRVGLPPTRFVVSGLREDAFATNRHAVPLVPLAGEDQAPADRVSDAAPAPEQVVASPPPPDAPDDSRGAAGQGPEFDSVRAVEPYPPAPPVGPPAPGPAGSELRPPPSRRRGVAIGVLAVTVLVGAAVAALATTLASRDRAPGGEAAPEPARQQEQEPPAPRDGGATGDGSANPAPPAAALQVRRVGRYESGRIDANAAERLAYDPSTRRAYVTNVGDTAVDVLDLSDPRAPALVRRVRLGRLGVAPRGVTAHDGLVAVAMWGEPRHSRGRVVWLDEDGAILGSVRVGAQPDMVTFTPDGTRVLVANEAHPARGGDPDPPGTVSVVTVADRDDLVDGVSVRTITFDDLDPNAVRTLRLSPGSTVAQDVEPEAIVVAPDSRTAWVTLQENNAIAVVDVAAARVERVFGAGTVDHSLPGAGLDASDVDGRVRIRRWPVAGLRQPGPLTMFQAGGATYVATSNEGSPGGVRGATVVADVQDLTLCAREFPDRARLQRPRNLGRLSVSTIDGLDAERDCYHELRSFGGRGFSIFTGEGQLVFDSGDGFERAIADALPEHFNSENKDNTFDTRSDDLGPEPEGIAVGPVGDRIYAFTAIETVGGFTVYDVTDPARSRFVRYVTARDFSAPARSARAGDVTPVTQVFVAADDSPSGQPLLLVANETSGTTSVYELSLD